MCKLRAGSALPDSEEVSVLNPDPLVVSLCAGVEIDIPCPFAENYPIAFHSSHSDVSFHVDMRDGVVRSNSCQEVVSSSHSTPCGQCKKLLIDINTMKILGNIELRAWDQTLHSTTINSTYLSYHQVLDRAHHWVESTHKYRSLAFFQNKALRHLLRAKSYQDRIFQLLRENKIIRLSQILQQLSKRGASLPKILTTLVSAVNGCYKAKGFDKDDTDKSLLYLCLGGMRLLHAAQTIDGDASRTTSLGAGGFVEFTNMASTIDESIIVSNLNRSVFSLGPAPEPCLVVLQMDDIKGQSNLRHDHKHMRVLGICYHAVTEHISPEARSWEDVLLIVNAIETGKIHLATEFTNVALARNAQENYSSRLVACSAGCLCKDPIERLELLIVGTIKCYNRSPESKTHGELATFQPDGAFAGLCHRLFFTQPMGKAHRLYRHLSILPLYCLRESSHAELKNVIACSEQKHVLKTFRRRLKSQKGTLIHGSHITGPSLRLLFEESGLFLPSDVGSMFATDFHDGMRVPPAVAFLRAVIAISKLDPSAFGKRERMFSTLRVALVLLAHVCEFYVTLIADNRPSLGQHMENVSKLMHLSLVLYREHATGYMPAQTYRNTQVLGQSLYWALATCKQVGIKKIFIFLDAGDKLETLHGIERSTSHSGSNMDFLQKQERSSAAMTVGRIYADHPDWERPPRHLATTSGTGSNDRQNPSSFLHVYGTKSPREYDYSRVNVDGVSLLNSFTRGRLAADKALCEAGFPPEKHDWKEMESTGVDMLRPRSE